MANQASRPALEKWENKINGNTKLFEKEHDAPGAMCFLFGLLCDGEERLADNSSDVLAQPYLQ